MKRIVNLIWRILAGLVLAVVLVPMALGLLLAVGFEEWREADQAPGREVLTDVGLTELAEYAPRHYLQLEGAITAFTLGRYDNWTDKNDLRAMLMEYAATRDGWQVEAVSPEAYAELLQAHYPEASFLGAGDVTFDAWYQAGPVRAFFDQETGLMVHWRTGASPRSRKAKAAGLTVSTDGFLYEMETHGGFHGDGTTWQALIVPPAQRADVEAAIAAHADWHEGTVTVEEYARLHTRVYQDLPELLPAVDFERWYYVDTYARMYPDQPERGSTHADFPAVMQQANARWTGNWEMAFYDPDTGLLIYYEYDS